MTIVKTLVLTGYGINCEEEVADCFFRAGSQAEIVHLNHLIANPKLLEMSDILALPGGFSYGDHIACGKNFSNKIRFNLEKPFENFIGSGKPVIGVCNGYQILVKLGVLPNLTGKIIPEFTFTNNSVRGVDGGGYSYFEDRWVYLKVNSQNNSLWLQGVSHLELPVRHGEGRLVCPDKKKIEELISREQVAMYYAIPGSSKCLGNKNASNNQTEWETAFEYPFNPNGSLLGIAALTNRQGNVIGMMPHPEAYSLKEHYPNFLGQSDPVLSNDFLPKKFFQEGDGSGMIFFYNAVNYVRDKFRK